MRNTMWSDLVQGIDTLYYSRMLRFDDIFKRKYTEIFCIEGKEKILEIGCGPGALAQSLSRWYPDSEVIGIDRDSEFIRFASEKAPSIKFFEGDAAALPFSENSFDVTISNTVHEHIKPLDFFGEQYRVLKPNGVCIVMSARRGITSNASCIDECSDFENEISGRVEKYCDEVLKGNSIGAYRQSERDIPLTMSAYGFKDIRTDYLAVNLTPDNTEYPEETARTIINEGRFSELDYAERLLKIAPDIVSAEEISKLKKIINQKYDRRVELYDSGQKQWDTSVSLTMIVRGVK